MNMQHSSLERETSKIQGQVSKNDGLLGSTEVRLDPLDFDEFMPLMCLQYQSPEAVIVTRIYKEEYVKTNLRRTSTKSVKSAVKSKQAESQEVDEPRDSVLMTPTEITDCVQITACYNPFGLLQEVSITECPFNINRTIIQIFCLAVPYHPTLSKLTICKGGLTATVLVEISKILPYSYITDICLDGTNVPQRNYSVLLQNTSRLANMSLNRCKLGDKTCKEIVASMDVGAPGATLRSLELSSNRITDDGALAFANLLRRNRLLLHLNLSGNLITDEGAEAILDTMMEFPMTHDEILEMKRNRMEFQRKKIALYDEYLKELMMAKQRVTMSVQSGMIKTKSQKTPTGNAKVKSPGSKKLGPKKSLIPDSIPIEWDGPEKNPKLEYAHPELEQKARDVMGEFRDPFDTDHTVIKDRYSYCVGNMFLCSLNLAYNNLGYSSIHKICLVLEYQSATRRPPGSTGLLRITFEGNYIPKYCDEYVQIEMLLQNATSNQLPKAPAGTPKKKGGSAGTRKSTQRLL